MVFRVKSLDHLIDVWMPQHFKDLYFLSEELKVLCFIVLLFIIFAAKYLP